MSSLMVQSDWSFIYANIFFWWLQVCEEALDFYETHSDVQGGSDVAIGGPLEVVLYS